MDAGNKITTDHEYRNVNAFDTWQNARVIYLLWCTITTLEGAMVFPSSKRLTIKVFIIKRARDKIDCEVWEKHGWQKKSHLEYLLFSTLEAYLCLCLSRNTNLLFLVTISFWFWKSLKRKYVWSRRFFGTIWRRSLKTKFEKTQSRNTSTVTEWWFRYVYTFLNNYFFVQSIIWNSTSC